MNANKPSHGDWFSYLIEDISCFVYSMNNETKVFSFKGCHRDDHRSKTANVKITRCLKYITVPPCLARYVIWNPWSIARRAKDSRLDTSDETTCLRKWGKFHDNTKHSYDQDSVLYGQQHFHICCFCLTHPSTLRSFLYWCLWFLYSMLHAK